ncbi:MAG: hypothetical protein ACM3U2_09430 [Deltaproteobacteria bacterium]
MRFSLGMTASLSRLCAVGLIAIMAFSAAGVAAACPICGVPTVTLAERYARSDAALLVEWVSAQRAQGKTPESTTYEIVQAQRDPSGTFKAGERVEVPKFTQGKAGNLYLLLGRKDDKLGIKWEDPPLAVSETSFQYIAQAPSPETPAEKRLGYFVKFLEYPDLTIANDAFAQFVNAPTQDIAAVAGKLPREKLRRWLTDPKTPVNRQAGYGLMLGLCGGTEEARFLEQRIATTEPERQIGIEGLMFGYLLLTGENGLAVLQKKYLADPKASDGETYAAVLAVRYYWSYGNGKIPAARLQGAMRAVLDRPAFAEGAITDLARWKDWSLHDRLMQLYGTKEYNEKSAKKAIISYMIASTKDVGKEANEVPPHVDAGRKGLERLRQRDPKLVEEVEKFFLLQ